MCQVVIHSLSSLTPNHAQTHPSSTPMHYIIMFLLTTLVARFLLLFSATGIITRSWGAKEPRGDQTPWKQDRFAISFWVDPMVPPERFDAEYKRVAQANFTVLLGGFGAKDRDTVSKQIMIAAKNGLEAIPSICNGACVNISGAWGFQIADEPAVSQLKVLQSLSQMQKQSASWLSLICCRTMRMPRNSVLIPTGIILFNI